MSKFGRAWLVLIMLEIANMFSKLSDGNIEGARATCVILILLGAVFIFCGGNDD